MIDLALPIKLKLESEPLLFQQIAMLTLNPIKLTLLFCRVSFLSSVLLILAYLIVGQGHYIWLKLTIFKEKWISLRKKEQIPCYFCIYCTDEESLKCTVHPDIALSKKAVDCLDFHPIDRRL